jgi:hypothetical protein
VTGTNAGVPAVRGSACRFPSKVSRRYSGRAEPHSIFLVIEKRDKLLLQCGIVMQRHCAVEGVVEFAQATGADIVTSVATSDGTRDAKGIWTPDHAKVKRSNHWCSPKATAPVCRISSLGRLYERFQIQGYGRPWEFLRNDSQLLADAILSKLNFDCGGT